MDLISSSKMYSSSKRRLLFFRMIKILILIGIVSANKDTCSKKGDCEREEEFGNSIERAAETKDFIPFRYTSKSRYIDDFDKFITAYGKWQTALLDNPNLNCKGRDAYFNVRATKRPLILKFRNTNRSRLLGLGRGPL